jgi:hypothetical protein
MCGRRFWDGCLSHRGPVGEPGEGGSIYREFWELAEGGLCLWSISLYGSCVRGTWRGATWLRTLPVMKGRLWGQMSPFMGAQLGNLEWAHLLGTLRDGWKGFWRLSIPLYGSCHVDGWNKNILFTFLTGISTSTAGIPACLYSKNLNYKDNILPKILTKDYISKARCVQLWIPNSSSVKETWREGYFAGDPVG